MPYLLDNNRKAIGHTEIEHSVAPKNLLSDLLPMDAQAVYQVALAQLRLHRNRWKAPGPTQADPSHT